MAPFLLRPALAAAIALFCQTDTETTGRYCPSLTDQTVIVPAGTATPLHLNVDKLGSQTVNIFQFPAGGVLVPDGPSQLDYVYYPNNGFSGVTWANYRVSQPNACNGPTPIGKVTFVVSGPGQTNVDLNGGLGVRPVICGADFLPVAVPPPFGFWLISRVRRRTNRLRAARRAPSD